MSWHKSSSVCSSGDSVHFLPLMEVEEQIISFDWHDECGIHDISLTGPIGFLNEDLENWKLYRYNLGCVNAQNNIKVDNC
jgi:hypothetical protein